ncbi:uncharacterized protein LOC120849001 [Ixodes scapularis]|uniref:uncharacterized protein LOC120844868 n=1 Tax=Ixodes scapularis TaxID=6945 RepID=UPI001A9DC632|nr:uncharacterized protein LOC120844868 [Ixodes scapularis]XP_040076760.1 uncharacterized protein LOC120848801 [Ixodes scapularis]XP_040077022.1 uncharacterized protein LOC120849001 [Ixodes scapularis]
MIISDSNSERLISKTNNVLSKLKTWCINNSLHINASKSKAIIFQLHSRTQATSSSLLKYGTDIIQYVENVKTLGVFFSYNMSWNDHIRHVRTKLSRIVGVLNKYRNILPTSVKIQLFKSLFYPILCYAHLVWGSTGTTNLNLLRILQKKALRAIANVSSTSPSLPLFEKYSILDVSKMYPQRLILTFQSAMKGKYDTFLAIADLHLHDSIRQTRQIHPWHIPQSRTNFGRQRIKHALPELLNHIASLGIDVMSVGRNDISCIV